MVICLCHRVSDRDIARAAVGCADFEMLQDELRVGTACGACLECARDEFDQQLQRPNRACAALRPPVAAVRG